MFYDLRLGVYCCGHVFRRERAVLLVVRDGTDWQFICGGVDHSDPDEPYHVCIAGLLDEDGTLAEVSDLAPDAEAERQRPGANWLRTLGCH